MGDVKKLLESGDFAGFRAAVTSDPSAARHPKVVNCAAALANQKALQLLLKAGADLNGVYRNYRPLHNLLQTDPHKAAGKPSPDRLACLEWMLGNGANPELTAAWPSARAIIIAAFVGSPEYVATLRKAGAKVDGFAGAALGDRKLVEKALGEQPSFATERDSGVLTALHCAAGSRMPKADLVTIAKLLLDSGAEVAATAKSWAHEVDAAYFAAGRKSLPMFELLLERGADPTEALAHAVWASAYELAERALAHGASIDRAVANHKPLLNDMICWGQIPQTMWLLERGASANVPDAKGWTAVHQAASRGNARMLRAVLEAGGEKRRKDKEGNLPRDIARVEKVAEMLT
jgi:ankyrin repeat protein